MVRSLFLLAIPLSLSASACGGVFLAGDDGGADSGKDAISSDGGESDGAGTCDLHDPPTGPGGCLMEDPAEGSCCRSGQSICETGDPCCVGYVWACQSGKWQKEGLGCACMLDAGSGDAAKGDDAGPTSCGKLTCKSGEVCVVQESSEGPCLRPDDAGVCPPPTTSTGGCCTYSTTTYQCQPEPASCDGHLTCGCATSLCQCECTGAMGSTLQCACSGA
jgi:hypothetical protein